MNIFVANLSYRIESSDLQDIFEEYGEVSSAKIVNDRETGRSRGFGFVEMSDDDAARKAIEELHGAEYDGREMTVKEAEDRKSNNRGGGGGRRERRY